MKTEVSKSSDVVGRTDGSETMRTEREGRPLAGAREMRGFRVVEDDGEDPSLNPRVLENALHGGEEDSGAGADTPGVKEVVAAINAQ